jgi:hypothetical protein
MMQEHRKQSSECGGERQMDMWGKKKSTFS